MIVLENIYCYFQHSVGRRAEKNIFIQAPVCFLLTCQQNALNGRLSCAGELYGMLHQRSNPTPIIISPSFSFLQNRRGGLLIGV